MTPELLCRLIIRPVIAELSWPQPREREVLLCAIAVQESELIYRRQLGGGPARSWWQIELPTAADCLARCEGASRFWDALGFATAPLGLELELNDLGACAIAAGILRLHPGKLPEVEHMATAWHYYLASWRPGVPRPESWHDAYADAMRAAGGPPVMAKPVRPPVWPTMR